MRGLVVCCALAGCGFHSQPGDVDGGGDLAGVSDDAAPLDDGASSDGNPGDLAFAPCARPYLLLSYDASQHPLVMRFSLAAGFTACAPLTGGNTIPTGSNAAAFIPPNGVAVTGSAGTVLIDADRDTPMWSNSIDGVDVLPLALGGPSLVGIARGAIGSKTVGFLDVYQDATTRLQHFAFDGANQPIGNVFALAAHPLTAGHLLALTIGNTPSAATDLDPIAKTTGAMVAYPGTSVKLNTIAAISSSGAQRIAWVDIASNGIYYADGSNPAAGPIACASESCTLVDVVPDPTSAAWFALCDYGTKRSILKMQPGSCSVAHDGNGLPADLLATDLSLAP